MWSSGLERNFKATKMAWSEVQTFLWLRCCVLGKDSFTQFNCLTALLAGKYSFSTIGGSTASLNTEVF